jgi:hypothetical protein
MSGWIDVFNAAIGVVKGQPIQYQVASVIGVAFFVVMFLEGIRSSFFRRRKYD